MGTATSSLVNSITATNLTINSIISNSSTGNSTNLIDKTKSAISSVNSTVINSQVDMATNNNNHKTIISSTTREPMVSTTTSTARANTPSTVPATGSSVRTDLIQ